MEAEKIVRSMINAIGDESDQIDLKETPERVAKMWKEVFRGYDLKQKPKLTVFPNNEDVLFA